MRKSVNFFLDILFRGVRNDHFRSWAQFTSNLWSQLCLMLNIAHHQTTAYHPESNGAVKDCTAASRKHSAHAPPRQLGPMSYLLYSSVRAQPRKDTGLSLAESVFGAPIVLPNEFLQSDELAGESRFHISTPLGIEPGSLMTGSKRVDHWTSGTVCECSEIAALHKTFWRF